MPLIAVPQDTVAALIQTAPSPPPLAAEPDIDGLPLVDNTPIDFSGGTSIDGMPLEPVRVCVVFVHTEDVGACV